MIDFRNRHAIEELDQLLDAGAPGDGDDVRSEVLTLVELASTVGDQSALPRPDPAFRTHLRAQLLRLEPVSNPSPAARLRDRANAATVTGRRAFRVAAASAVAASMLGTAGVAAAAESALPGDVLYSVKSLVEEARLLLADSGTQDGQLLLAFARERLDEVAAGTDRLSADQLVDLLARMDAASIAGSEELLNAASTSTTSELLSLVVDFVAEQQTLLRAMEADLPAAAAPFLADSFENLRRIDLQVQALEDPACDCQALQPDDDVVDEVAPRAVDVAPVTIVPAGDGPAAPSRPCACDVQTVTPPREPAPASTEPVDQQTPTPPPVDVDPDVEPDPDQPDPDQPDPDPTPSDDPLVPIPSIIPSDVDDQLDPDDDIVEDVLPDPVEEALTPTTDLVDELLGSTNR